MRQRTYLYLLPPAWATGVRVAVDWVVALVFLPQNQSAVVAAAVFGLQYRSRK